MDKIQVAAMASEWIILVSAGIVTSSLFEVWHRRTELRRYRKAVAKAQPDCPRCRELEAQMTELTDKLGDVSATLELIVKGKET